MRRHRRYGSRKRRYRARRGFALIEIVLALVLVGVGLLALGATSTLVSREIGGAGTRVAAALAARNRVEWFAATPCALLASGVAVHPHGVREWWSIERTGRLALLRDSVVIDEPHGARWLVLESGRAC